MIVRETVPLVSIACTGSVMSLCWYLSFFPPERYQRWLRRGAVPPADAAI